MKKLMFVVLITLLIAGCSSEIPVEGTFRAKAIYYPQLDKMEFLNDRVVTFTVDLSAQKISIFGLQDTPLVWTDIVTMDEGAEGETTRQQFENLRLAKEKEGWNINFFQGRSFVGQTTTFSIFTRKKPKESDAEFYILLILNPSNGAVITLYSNNQLK